MTAPGQQQRDDTFRIAIWLLIVAALVFCMVLIGGVTRLTGSGLSMVEWKPATGFIPPLNDTDWQVLFDKYRQFPEFMYVNRSMDLAGFKGIFWLEFIHRLLGRLTGVVFLLPFIFFLLRRSIPASLTPRLVAMFMLGGLQGLLGWYMVKSGLVNDPHVSQYRLTAHLMLAVLIYSLVLWTALDLLRSRYHSASPGQNGKLSSGLVLTLALMVVATMISGGFVAGLKAGLIYNTFPLMGDALIAPGVYATTPWYLAAMEDAVTVQFNHRILALTTFTMILLFWISQRRQTLGTGLQLLMNLLLVAVLFQVALGITTLLLRVPVGIAAAHQVGALILLSVLILLLHKLRASK